MHTISIIIFPLSTSHIEHDWSKPKIRYGLVSKCSTLCATTIFWLQTSIYRLIILSSALFIASIFIFVYVSCGVDVAIWNGLLSSYPQMRWFLTITGFPVQVYNAEKGWVMSLSLHLFLLLFWLQCIEYWHEVLHFSVCIVQKKVPWQETFRKYLR